MPAPISVTKTAPPVAITASQRSQFASSLFVARAQITSTQNAANSARNAHRAFWSMPKAAPRFWI